MRLKGEVTRVSTFLDRYVQTITTPVAILINGEHVNIELEVSFHSTKPSQVGTIRWFEILPEETIT